MEHARRRCTTARLVAPLLCISLLACDRDPVGPTPDGASGDRRVSPAAAIQTSDEALEALGARLPGGFAGMYLGPDDRLHLRLVRSAEKSRAVAALLAAGARGRRGAPLAESDIVVEPARFEFRQLAAWRRLIADGATGVGLSLLDVDEFENRLYLGAVAPGDSARLRELARRHGIPDDGVEIAVAGVLVRDVGTVQSLARPLLAGYRVEAAGSFGAYCSMGFNVKHWQHGEALVTNSHCSQAMGSANGHVLYQPFEDPGNGVATELLDPPYTAGSGCRTYYRCRYSDAALYVYTPTYFETTPQMFPDDFMNAPNWGRGFVAAPPSRTTSLAAPVLTVSGYVKTARYEPLFCPIDQPCGVQLNDRVGKVGAASGWTSGVLTRTCIDLYFPDGLGIRCSSEATYLSDGGDSGSPVLWEGRPPYDPLVTTPGGGDGGLLGIHHTRNTVTGRRYFSPMRLVERELGYNTAIACNGFKVSKDEWIMDWC